MNFSGKRVLITGGSRGIGKAAAQAFAAAGARVAINFNSNKAAAGATIDSLTGEGHFAVKANISHPEAVAGMVDAVSAEMGGIDILVNNAGIFIPHPLAEVDYEEWQAAWQQTMDTNLTGAANVTYCVARRMIEQGGGRIVFVSSRGAFRGEPTHPAYGASKAGMNALAQSLAQALAPHNIFIGTLAPGFVETDMTAGHLQGESGAAIRGQVPNGRVAQPEEMAHCILFLASEQAAYTTGCILDANGGSYLR
ncbi:MAG: SDR family NAD(P)-dependent oxidoreductase [Phaeodactylibacter sp.]|uniref:SDR family NAD(P)-dependent oxidoreductase n=1 Tax=Phaeodactylibacter sp. TaxID=1940289 RepID=UPI0032ECA02F